MCGVNKTVMKKCYTFNLLSQFRGISFSTTNRPLSICHIFGCFIWLKMWKWRFSFKHLLQLRTPCFRTKFIYFASQCYQGKKLPHRESFQKRKHQPSYHIFDAWRPQGPYTGLLFCSDSKKKRWVKEDHISDIHNNDKETLTTSSLPSHFVHIMSILNLHELA